MNAKYSFSQYVIVTLVAVAVLVFPTACNDDLGYSNNAEGQRIAFKLTASDTWYKGMSVNENEPTTHCTSVRALSGGDTKLYLHTVVADNPAEEKVAVTRGTPVRNTAAFQDRYKRFSLSGICYTGEYPTDESQNTWTTEYAYNLYYGTASGMPVEGGRPLLWPANGQVRFFAFAPIVADFDELKTGGSLTLSAATYKGSPMLTYTVPTDVTKQVDLMTVCTPVKAATTPEVELNFGHALTAVQIKCGKDMLAGKITEVTIDGIHGTGKQVIGADTWTTLDDHKAKYTISKEITLSPGEGVTDKIHVPENTPIVGTDDDGLTFMLLPQTLPEGATMTIKFTDDVTQTERTLNGSIAGQKWEAGKIVTYSVSPSSIHISAKVEFDNKKGISDENPTGDIMPYSGVWYDVKYTARVEFTQEDVDTKTIDIPADEVKFRYMLEGSGSWVDCTKYKDDNGLVAIESQPAYTNMNTKFDKTSENGSKEAPYILSDEYGGETANCYLVDKAGYYSLPLVYGNGCIAPTSTVTSCFRYYPKHDDDTAIPTDGKVADAVDAVLCWQDAPDLIDSASVKVVKAVGGDNLVFRIRKQTLAQGNALLAVRNEKKEILWSWHIWVTPYKTSFYGDLFSTTTYMNMDVKTDELRQYQMARYNLGWCDEHGHNDSRTFRLQAVIDMSAYGGGATEAVDIGTFTQMEFKGSDAGDNTYYQWGRKDPMLGGIYNDKTPTYKYKKKGTTDDTAEFTMENKQVFNHYNQDGNNYSFCKNPGDKIDINDEASNGVTIGYTIKHPYMFVTNSRCADTDAGDDPLPAFNYRNHWHKWRGEFSAPYLQGEQILLNVWDADATTQIGTNTLTVTSTTRDAYLKSNAADVKKSVYDPCPPGFKIPPIDAFREIYEKLTAGNISVSESGNGWTVKCEKGNITFPSTGVRNYALRTNEWTTVVVNTGIDPGFTYEEFYKISMPAFKMLTFMSSATIIDNGKESNRNQLMYFGIRKKDDGSISREYGVSNNSYGLPVRPIRIQNN